MFSENIHYLVTLEVNQDGAGGVVSTQAEVVYTQHAHILVTSAQKASRIRFRRVSGLTMRPSWCASLAPA
jgi:hypothetical protein